MFVSLHVSVHTCFSFKSGVVVENNDHRQGPGQHGVTWLNEVDCVGTESNIADCNHSDWDTKCYYGIVSLQCSGQEHGKDSSTALNFFTVNWWTNVIWANVYSVFNVVLS